MTVVRRFHGFSVDPPVGENRSRTVSLGVDDDTLYEWVDDHDDPRSWALRDLRNWRVELSRSWRMFAEVDGVVLRWSAPHSMDCDEFTEILRSHGADVVRPRRGLRRLMVATAFLLILASLGGLLTYALTRTTTTVVTATDVGAINVRAQDIPDGWVEVGSTDANNALTILVGKANEVTTSSTTVPPSTGVNKTIWDTATARFQTCMGTTHAKDRMFGAAGEQPALQVSGAVYGANSFDGVQMASLTQYYASTDMVQRDLREYSRPAFAHCWALVNALILQGYLFYDPTYARGSVPVSAWDFTTITRGFVRTAVAQVTLPGSSHSYSLASAFAARGHYEMTYFALAGNWHDAQATAAAGLNAVLARMAPDATAPSRA